MTTAKFNPLIFPVWGFAYRVAVFSGITMSAVNPCHNGLMGNSVYIIADVHCSGKVVILTHRLRSTPQKHYFSASDTHFCQRLSEPQGLVQVEGSGTLKKFIHLIGSQPTTFRLVA
jgi:hypothetical protein